MEDFPDSVLTARLFRRASEPLGVIDVRHPERLQGRGMALMGQRLEMLDRWKTRYGLSSADAPADRDGTHPLKTFVHRPETVRAAGSDSSIASSFTSSAPPFVMRSAIPGADAVSHSDVSHQYRVRRPGELPDGSRRADAQSGSSGESGGAPLPRAAEVMVQSGSAPPLDLQRAQSDGHAVNRGDIPLAGAAGSSVDSIRQGSPMPETSGVAPSAPAALPAPPALAAALPATAPELPPASLYSEEMVLRRKVVEEPATSAASWRYESLPHVKEIRSVGGTSPSEPLLSRKQVLPEQGSSISGLAPRPSAMAPEIPTVSAVPSAAPIIWRRADPGTEAGGRLPAPPVSTTADVQIMRVPTAGSAQSFTAAAQIAAAEHLPTGGVDVEYLAERVSRVIARQLTVERERRGVAR